MKKSWGLNNKCRTSTTKINVTSSIIIQKNATYWIKSVCVIIKKITKKSSSWSN